jgi:hypothetical protein
VLIPIHDKVTEERTERREGIGWNTSAKDKKQWRAVVNMVMNLRLPLLNLLILVIDALPNGLHNMEAIYIT